MARDREVNSLKGTQICKTAYWGAGKGNKKKGTSYDFRELQTTQGTSYNILQKIFKKFQQYS